MSPTRPRRCSTHEETPALELGLVDLHSVNRPCRLLRPEAAG
jgi:hypothetical protein